MLIDGIPLLGSAAGNISWSVIPTSEIERVEIVKSGGSAMYGSSAMGGVLNIITRNAAIEPEIVNLCEFLNKMGARIEVDKSQVSTKGVGSLKGAVVRAPDIRGGAALTLAGLAAEGRTEIESIHHLDRGYERLEEKLSKLGAKITRVED